MVASIRGINHSAVAEVGNWSRKEQGSVSKLDSGGADKAPRLMSPQRRGNRAPAPRRVGCDGVVIRMHWIICVGSRIVSVVRVPSGADLPNQSK